MGRTVASHSPLLVKLPLGGYVPITAKNRQNQRGSDPGGMARKQARKSRKARQPAREAAPRRRRQCPIVALGASAGGLEACQRFFPDLPPARRRLRPPRTTTACRVAPPRPELSISSYPSRTCRRASSNTRATPPSWCANADQTLSVTRSASI